MKHEVNYLFFNLLIKTGLELWYLKLFSTIVQQYRGVFYLWRKVDDPEKTTDLSQVTDIT